MGKARGRRRLRFVYGLPAASGRPRAIWSLTPAACASPEQQTSVGQLAVPRAPVAAPPGGAR